MIMSWETRWQKRILQENLSHIGRYPEGLTLRTNKSGDKLIKYGKWDHQIIIGDYREVENKANHWSVC